MKKDLITSDYAFASIFLGDANKIDGVTLGNNSSQSTPKKAFLLSSEKTSNKEDY